MNTTKGTIFKISDRIPLKGKDNAAREKVLVGIETADEQTFFVDLIDNKIDKLAKLNLGDHVSVDFSFKGFTTVGGKSYNNLYCHNIEKL